MKNDRIGKRLYSILLVVILAIFMSACKNKEKSSGTVSDSPIPASPEVSDNISDSGIKIAVIDSGFSSSVISENNIFPGKNYICPEQDTEDRIGHGTALAAFIVGSEPARMEGCCPEAKLVPLVYADIIVQDGEEVETIGGPELVAEIVMDAVNVYDCRIILVSSGTKKDEPALREAVKYAKEHNVLVVSCAGNNGNTEETVYSPGGYEDVLCVGSVNEDGEIAYFSQNNEYIDIWEIGTDLRLATLKGTRIRGEGTSYSAAIVAGKAAAVWSENKELEIDEVIRILCNDKGVKCTDAP